jgi:hypothetical protein
MRLRNVATFLAKADPAAVFTSPHARDNNRAPSQPDSSAPERSPTR